MKKWSFIVAGLYGVVAVMLFFPLLGVSAIPSKNGTFFEFFVRDLFRNPFTGIGSLLLAAAIMALVQFALLRVPVHVASQRPVSRRPLLITIITAALMMGLLVLGGVASIIEFLKFDGGDWPPLIIIIASWPFWALYFYKTTTRSNPKQMVKQLQRYMWSGSILELLIAVPTHIVVRQRTYCCAAFLTFLGLTCGMAVMLFAFGPSVYFLYIDRWKRLHPKHKKDQDPSVNTIEHVAKDNVATSQAPFTIEGLYRLLEKNGNVSVGRTVENDIVLADDSVSEHHAEIYLAQGNLCIRDLESLNGTLLNNETINETAALRNNDTLRIGTITCKIICDNTQQSASADGNAALRLKKSLGFFIAAMAMIIFLIVVVPHVTLLQSRNNIISKLKQPAPADTLLEWQYYDNLAREMVKVYRKSPSPGTITELGNIALDHTYPYEGRRAAVLALTQIGSDARDPLVRIIRSDIDGGISYPAFAGISSIKPPVTEVIPLFIDQLKDYERSDRAKQALVGIGAPTVPFLLKRLGSDDPDLTETKLKILGQIGGASEPVVPELVAHMLGKPNIFKHPVSRHLCLTTISNIGPAAGLQHALPLLESRNHEYRQLGSSMLEAMSEKPNANKEVFIPALPKLIAALKRTNAVDSRSDSQIRRNLLLTIQRLGPRAEAAIPVVIQSISSDKLSLLAADVLGSIGTGDSLAVSKLMELLADETLDMRLIAARGLGRIGPGAKAAVPALIKALKTGHVNMRIVSAYALGRIRDKAAIPALKAALTDQRTYKPDALTSTFFFIAILADLFETPPERSHVGTRVSLAAQWSLGEIRRFR